MEGENTLEATAAPQPTLVGVVVVAVVEQQKRQQRKWLQMRDQAMVLQEAAVTNAHCGPL